MTRDPGQPMLRVLTKAPFFQLLDVAGDPIPEVDIFLRDVYARLYNQNSVRAYAYAILDWYRFLEQGELRFDEIKRQHVTDYILYLDSKKNPQRLRHSPLAPKAGSVNFLTGKRYLKEGYQPATIRQRVTTVSLFYDVLEMADLGPVVHPLGRRLESRGWFRGDSTLAASESRGFRRRSPQRQAHALSRTLLAQLLKNARCARDVALIEGYYCTAARAEELLALRIEDVLWDRHLVLLNTKGHLEKELVAVSARFLDRLRQYLDERSHSLEPNDPVWVTCRGMTRPLSYTGLRAILRRLNEKLGSNVSTHDLRATSATHLAENPKVAFVSIQHHMRHSSPASTERYTQKARGLGFKDVQEHFETYGNPSLSAQPSAKYNAASVDRVFGKRELE